MFCSRCGSELITDAKFCHLCGSTNGANEDNTTLSVIEAAQSAKKRPSSVLTFDDYRERKGQERRSRFGGKKPKKEKNEKVNEVTIQIGLIRLKDGELKVIRGSTLPLKVTETIGASELLQKGSEKMVKFNKDLASGGGFTLLYPDRTEVKNLPGSTEAFTLNRYREELGKPYARITLYICKTLAILDSMFLKTYNSDDSDTELPSYEEV